MKEFLHKEKEIYTHAIKAIRQAQVPTNALQIERVNVYLDTNDFDVVYTVSFSPIFNADTDTFVEWTYVNTEMYKKQRQR